MKALLEKCLFAVINLETLSEEALSRVIKEIDDELLRREARMVEQYRTETVVSEDRRINSRDSYDNRGNTENT